MGNTVGVTDSVSHLGGFWGFWALRLEVGVLEFKVAG